MKKNFFLIVLSINLIHFACIQKAYAQNSLVKKWDSRFGGNNFEWLTVFEKNYEGGYILGGWTESDSSGDISERTRGNSDWWVVKIDSLGNKEWDKRFGGNSMDKLFSIGKTFDHGYILGGFTWSDSDQYVSQYTHGYSDYWIVKIDSLGNKQWDKRFGGNINDELYSVQQTVDKGYILGGTTKSSLNGDVSQQTYMGDYWIVKTDSIGIMQWEKRYGGYGRDELRSLQQTSDGGYILGGFTTSDSSIDVSHHSRGNTDYWVLKIDSIGIKQWDKLFGGHGEDELHSLEETMDHGYILGGISYSDSTEDVSQHSRGARDYWIVKIDSLGNKQWDKLFGGSYFEDEFGNVFQTSDKGYLIAGTSYSEAGADKTENNLGREQTWIVKTDSLGSKLWDKTIFTDSGLEHDEIGFAVQTEEKEGCYVFANFTRANIGGYKTQTSQGDYDYWLIKFCDTTLNTSIIKTSIERNEIMIYPNPTTGIFHLTFSNQIKFISIRDVLGRDVFYSKNIADQIDLSLQPSGIYFLQATMNEKIYSVKLVKE
jgi:hypothetical protein